MARTAAAPARAAVGWRRDALLLGAAAAVIRLPDYFATRHLTYDDGGYLSAALALRDGELPFRDVFSSQGPLFLPLVWLADVVGFRTTTAPRLLALAAGVGVTIAVYAAGRRVTSRRGALLAAGLVTTSGSILWTTGPLTGDGIALAFAVMAVALALGYRDQPSTARAVVIGLAMGAALSIKAITVPAAVPIGIVLLARRRPRDAAAAATAAVAVFLAAALPWGLAHVWEQAFEYHRGAQREDSYAGNAVNLVRTLLDRDLPVVATAALAAGFAAARRVGDRRPAATPAWSFDRAGLLLGLWLAAQVLFLVAEPAMWRPHVAHVVPPLALLACLCPPPWRWLAVVAVPVLPWWAAHAQPVLWARGYGAEARTAVARLEALPDGAWAISDEPGLVWAAGRRTPAGLVDASIKRIQQGQIESGSLARAAAEPQVCAVLVWSGRYGDLPDLPARLAAEGYRLQERYGDERALYERAGCHP